MTKRHAATSARVSGFLIVLCLSGISNIATAEMRDQPSRDETRSTERCLKQAEGEKARALACAGKVAKKCMSVPGGDSTFGMRTCLDRELKIWDGMLNRSYKIMRSSLDGKARKALTEVQKTWIEWRNKKCSLPYVVHEGGTLAAVVATDCVLETTAWRAIELGAASVDR